MTSSAPLYQGLDRAALDREYDNRSRVPNHAELYAAWSEKARQVTPGPKGALDIVYDRESGQKLDVFTPESPGEGEGQSPNPVIVFYHGGYWMSRAKEDIRFLAGPWTRAGAVFVAVDYALMPRVTMAVLVEQCRRAAAWVVQYISEHGGDPERVFAAGNSAGGHITAMVLQAGWQGRLGVPADALKGGVMLSGLFDLTPMRLCYLQDTLGLSAEDAHDFSPQTLPVPDNVPSLIAVGGDESGEFIRQSKDYADRWQAAGADGAYLEVAGANHFTILDAFAGPESALGRATARMLGM